MAVISSDELTEWAAFYQLEPFGAYREDLHAGIVASTIANVHAKKGHHFKPADFMPRFDAAPQKVLTPDEMIEFVKNFGRRRG